MHGDEWRELSVRAAARAGGAIGLSTSLPTLPLAATGRLHGDSWRASASCWRSSSASRMFRVVLIHHPPVEGAHYFRRLTNAGALRDMLAEHGAELVLHGHHHEASLHWAAGHAIPYSGGRRAVRLWRAGPS